MKRLSSATFVFVLLLVLFPSCKQANDLFGKKKKAEAAAAVQRARLENIRVSDSLKKVQEAQKALEQARADSIRLTTEQTRSVAGSKYHIIVGSFYTSDYARQWAEAYRKKGFNAQVLKKRGSFFELVSSESFPDYTLALNKLLEYHEPAWIYVSE